MTLRHRLGLLWALVVSLVPAGAAAQAEPDRRITLLRGQLYQLQEGQQFTVFMVTPEGIILGDPLSRPAALWLKEQLAERFPGSPVRYVLLSHHVVERAAGGAVFRDGAELVGHREFNGRLSASRKSHPDTYKFVDDVKSIYDTRRTIQVGQSAVELIHVGSVEWPELTALFFPAEHLVFCVKPPPVTTVPFSFRGATPREVFTWLRALAPLQFDTIMFEDGRTVTRAEFDALDRHLEALHALAITGYERGQALSDLESRAGLDANNPHYAARAEQFERVSRAMWMVRAELSIAALSAVSPRNQPPYCGSYAFCSAGGAVPGGAAALTVLLGRSLGVAAEATFGGQGWVSRAAPAYAEEAAIRQSRVAVLGRWSPPRAGPVWFAAVGGVSHTRGSVRGMNQVIGVQLPIGGRHEIVADETRSGLTVGADILVRTGDRLRIVAPIRMTRMLGTLPTHWPSAADIHVGVGVGVRVFRRVN